MRFRYHTRILFLQRWIELFQSCSVNSASYLKGRIWTLRNLTVTSCFIFMTFKWAIQLFSRNILDQNCIREQWRSGLSEFYDPARLIVLADEDAQLFRTFLQLRVRSHLFELKCPQSRCKMANFAATTVLLLVYFHCSLGKKSDKPYCKTSKMFHLIHQQSLATNASTRTLGRGLPARIQTRMRSRRYAAER